LDAQIATTLKPLSDGSTDYAWSRVNGVLQIPNCGHAVLTRGA
jgi:hypothetical protein